MARRALVIGVNTYKHLSHLRFAEADALAIAAALNQPEAHFDKVDTLISHGYGAISGQGQVTVAAIHDAIAQLGRDAQSGDALLLYFSGHGCLHEHSTEMRVILGAYETSLDDLRNTVIDVAEIVEVLGRTNAKHIALVFDACREKTSSPGSGDYSKAVGQQICTTIEKSIRGVPSAAPSRGKNWEILTACSDGQVAKEFAGDGNPPKGGGIWTLGLLDSITRYVDALHASEAAAPLTLQQLFLDVADRHARERSSAARPWYHATGESLTLLSKVRRPERPPLEILTSDLVKVYAAPLKLSTDDRVSLQPVTKSAVYEQETVHLVPFRSDYQVKYLKDFKSLGVMECNDAFSVRLYLPNLATHEPPFNNLFILVNGLAESNSKILDEVGLQLARKGIPAVLLPLPRHFTRFKSHESHEDPYRPDPDHEKLYSQQILQTIYAHPAHLVYMFDQISADVNKFVNGIDRGELRFFSGLFDPKARVSLFGYSVGGLCTLGMILAEFQDCAHDIDIKTLSANEIEEKFRSASASMRFSCGVLLESGLPLDEIDTSKLYRRTLDAKPPREGVEKPPRSICELLAEAYLSGPHAQMNRKFLDLKFERLFSGRESEKKARFDHLIHSSDATNLPKLFERSQIEADCIWRDIIMDLHNLVERGFTDITAARVDLFRRVFLGDHPTRNKFELDALNRKILCVAGGEDEIFPAVNLLASPMGGLATLQVPGMSHWLKVSGASHWAYWHRLIIDLAVGFEQAYDSSRRHIPG